MSPADLGAAMEAALASLPGRQRDVFIALADGHSLKSAAESLGIGYRAAQTHSTRAKAKVADHLLPLLYDLIREEGAA